MSSLKTLSLIVFLLLLAGTGVVYAAANHGVQYGTKHNDWGPPKSQADGSPPHDNWPLPNDCGNKGRRGDIAPKMGAHANHIKGRDGCDFFWAGDGNDVVYLGKEMDAGYGGGGNDRIFGEKGHDHLFGDTARGAPAGNDYLDTRDGIDEKGNKEEVFGGGGTDRCFLNPDPDGVKFNDCEFLNGSKNPWGHSADRYINTGKDGNQTELRKKVNQYLSRHP
jgi:hypothetical protein